MNSNDCTQAWKRSKTKYYIESIFKPPENITCTNFPIGDEGKKFSGAGCNGYFILEFEPVFQRISLLLKCKMCSGTVTFAPAQIRGLGFKLVVGCGNCGELDRIDSSKIIGPTSNDYEINARNESACQYLAGGSDNQSKAFNHSSLNPQQQQFSNPAFRSTSGNEMFRFDQTGSGSQNQNTHHNYYPESSWPNHSLFGSEQDSHMLLQNQESWQMGCQNDVATPEPVEDDSYVDSEGEEDDDDSEGSQQYNSTFQNTLDFTQQNSVESSGRVIQRRPRRRIVKKKREDGQCLTADTPLPNFSTYVLEELAKPTPRMSVVLPPCKAHIVAVTGDEYPTKKEYEIFSLKMVLAFPSLKDPDTDHGFERFKKSLSASFRARRSYEKNIKPSRIGKKPSGFHLPSSNCTPDPISAASLNEADQNNQLNFNQPSTSSLSLDMRLEDDDNSREMLRSYGESEWQDGSDSEESEQSGSYSQHAANVGGDGEGHPKRKRRRAVKKIRGEGQSITSDTPLPDFSLDVLEELAKPTPRMSVVLPPCKAHIVAVTGDEYPTKKEYEIFSLKMVLAFPTLKDPDTDHGFERFKKSLSCSFRARRSYELNKKPCRLQKRALAQFEVRPIRPANDLRYHQSQLQVAQEEEMRAADEELSRIDCDMEPERAKFLIEKSLNYRRKVVSAAGFDDMTFLQMYKHLHNCDMVLYEYSLIVGISIQELKNNFEEGLMVLTNMFWDAAQLSHLSKELKKVHVLVQLQDHFLNQKHMRQDVKPLFVMKDQMAAFNDGDISFRSTQVPCALVLTSGGVISKLMVTYKDSILLENSNTTAFDVCVNLLAFFFIMNIKYPPVYLDNLKALERLLNRKLCFSSLQTAISSPYSNYVKLYDAKCKEVQHYFKPEPNI